MKNSVFLTKVKSDPVAYRLWQCYDGTIKSGRKVADNEFKVTMTVNAEAAQIAANNAVSTIEEESCPITPLNKKNTVVVIRSNQMGNGEEELGKALLKGFIYALSQQDTLPSTILFYNSGAYITCEDSASIEDLKSLEATFSECTSYPF